MANPSSASPAVPSAHEGAHYTNPGSKTLEGRVPATDREGTQRVVWVLFYLLILGGVGVGVLVGMGRLQ
jgi:hypothetical protein